MAGFECEFVEPPPKIFVAECPICLHVLREPYQATCCGKNFCKTCLEVIKENKKPCPCCKSKRFSDFEDKRMQQTLYNMKVHCIHRNKGCEWTGELRTLDSHLNEGPLIKYALDGCPFTVTSCPLSYTGCEVELPRKEITFHLSEGAASHMVLLADSQLSINAELNTENNSLKEELQHKSKQIDDLKLDVYILKNRVKALEEKVSSLSKATGLPIGPVDFIMHNFDKNKRDKCVWWSAPFYTHPQGYKMVLRVDANGLGEGRGTHITLAVCLREGEFDQVLKWPFRGTITVQILSQEAQENLEHCISILTQSREDVVMGIGKAKFVSHSDLVSMHYLKNDCLVFRVSKIELK